MTKEEARIACQEALDVAKANWSELDTATIIPVTGDVLDFLPESKSYRARPTNSSMDSIRIELERVEDFILGYNHEHKVLAVKCYPEGEWYIPVVVTGLEDDRAT